jgi:hypothetical protein
MAVKGASNGIPLTERVFQIRGQALAPKISNGADAVQNIVPLLGGNPGIAFLDKGNRIMAVLPLTLQEMANLVTTRNKRGTMGIEQVNTQGLRTTSETIDVGSTAKDNNPLARILTVMDRSNTEQIIISIGDAAIDSVEVANATDNIQFAADKYKINVLDTINNKRNIRASEMTPGNLGGVNQTPKLPTGERLGFNEGNEEYDPSPLENAESQAAQDYPEVMANRKATQRADGGEDGGAGIEGIVRNGLQEGEADAGFTPEQLKLEAELLAKKREAWDKYSETRSKADLEAYGNAVDAHQAAVENDSIPDRIAQMNPKGGWLQQPNKSRPPREARETNPEDPNAGAEFARQEREAGERVNGPLRSGLEGAQPAEPIIKKTRKPRAKPAAPNPSVFPTKLDSTLPFGRLTGDQMAQFGLSDAMLDQFVEHSTIGHVMSGVEFVKDADDAAHVVAGLRKRTQEQIILLITDKNGRPIQIAGHQIGGPTSTGFNPGILIGTAASTPGAAKVWFIHNHPSGKSSLSPADITSGGNIERLLKAANLDYMGTMAVAGTRYAQMTPSGRIESNRPIKPAPRKFKVPVTERMFSFRVGQDKVSHGDPTIVMTEAERIFGKDQPGLILLDNSNRMVATIPLAADVLQAMKAKIPGTDQTGFNRFVSGIDRSNPVNVMIYTASLDPDVARKVIQNMSGVAQATKLNVLDAFGAGSVSRQSDIRPYGSDFNESGSEYTPDGGQASEPQTLRDVVDQAAKKKNELEVGEGEPDADSMAEAIKAEPMPSAADMAKLTGRLVPNHDDGLLASQGFITNRASQDMARIMERINKRFPDGYPVDGWNDDGTYSRGKKKIANLRLRYESDGDPIGNYDAQDYVFIDAVFEDGTTRLIASLDLMRGYGSTPEFPTLVTKVGMSSVNTDLQKLGLGSILYVEGGERLRRMGQRYITGSVINPAAVATRVRAFPAGSTELLAVPGSTSMSQKEMADAALKVIQGGVAAYTQTTLDPDVALEPGAEANQDDQLTEPGAGYDDGENMRIPGGARDKFLDDKAQLEKAFKDYGYMTLGHGIDTHGDPRDKTGAWKKNVRMFIIDEEGMVKVSDTLDKEEKRYIQRMQKEWVGMAVTLKDMLKVNPNAGILIHRQLFAGLRPETVQGRVEIRDGVAYVSVIKNNHQAENTPQARRDRLDHIRGSVRDALFMDGINEVRVIDMSMPADADPTRDADSAREPGIPYDDGENTRIPGSERDERLKKLDAMALKMERLGYMHIGHGYNADYANPTAWKKNAKLWSFTSDNRIVFSKTLDKLEKAAIKKYKIELKQAEEKLAAGGERAYYEYRIRWLKGRIDRMNGDMKSHSSHITHGIGGGFNETEYNGRNPQGRVEVTEDGVLVSITRFRGNMESVADERMIMQELRDAVADDLNVSPDTVRVVDMDGGTDETDTMRTTEDDSAREPGAEYGKPQKLSVERAFPDGERVDKVPFSNQAKALIPKGYKVELENKSGVNPTFMLTDKDGNYLLSVNLSFRMKETKGGLELVQSPARKKAGFPDKGASVFVEAFIPRDQTLGSKHDEAMVGLFHEILERSRQIGATRVYFDTLDHGRLTLGFQDDMSGQETRVDGNPFSAIQVAMGKTGPEDWRHFDENWSEAIFALDPNKAYEPGAAYDDGENQAIPGGGRQAWLKQQAELRAKNELPGAKRIQWWTDVGHKVGKKNREKTWLWAYDKQGKLQVINAQELKDKLGEDHMGRETHLDWEEGLGIPGLLAGAAHGRIDATEGVIRVSLAGRISDPTFREQVKQELAEYIGADVDKVKGYDFTGDGMPELFNRTEADQDGDMDQIVSDLEGMDVDEAKAYFHKNPDKALIVALNGLPPHLEKILKAMRDVGYNETKAYLEAHPIGRLLLANGRIVLVRDASEIPGLSPLEAASGGFNALVLGNDREATYFVGGAISKAEIDALIKHEVGVHMGIGKDTDLVNDLYDELWRLVESGEGGDMDRIMAQDAISDAFSVVAGHYGLRGKKTEPKQQGDRILDAMHSGLGSPRTRFTEERIVQILKDEGLSQKQIDNFLRVFHEETLGYLMNIMARRDARVNAPKDGLFAIIVRWIKSTMIRMAYARSQGGERPLAGRVMRGIGYASLMADSYGMKQLSQLLEIRPADIRAIAQGYAKAYAAGKEIGMPETRTDTVEGDIQHEARDAQEARVAGTTGDAVTDAATYSNENITLFSKRKPGQDPIKPENQAGTEESVAKNKGKKTGLLKSDSTKDRADPPIPLSALQVETGRQMLWREVPNPGTSEFDPMTEDPGVIPQSQIGVGSTRDSSMLVGDESGNPIEFPRITSIQGFAGKLGDLAALLDLPVHITQGRQGTGMNGDYAWVKGQADKLTDIGQMSSGFGLEHASWKHGYELDAMASVGKWAEGNTIAAIQKILSDATHAVVSRKDGQVNAINVYSKETGMTVVLRVGGKDRKMLHVVTVLPGKPGKDMDFVNAVRIFKDHGADETVTIGESKADTQATPQANEPGADYGQAEQTGEQQAAAEAETLEKLREVQGNGPAGPKLFNAIPPTPPPPAPTTPTSPAPAPLNPPATNDDMARRVGDVLRGRYFDGISTKAHQNAERTGSAAVRAVADIIHTRPGTENPSSERDLPKAIMTARAKYQNKFNEIMRPLRDQLGRMTSEQREQFYRELVDQITGRTNIQPGVAGHAATQLIALLKELHDYRTAAGEDLGQVQQYFPAVYNSELITANKAAFIADATRAYEIELSQDPNLTPQEIQMKAAAAAAALYRTHTRGMGDAEWSSIFNTGQGSSTENSSKERVFGRQAQGIMSKWQTPDPFYVISRYIGSAVKRAELVRRFGAEGQKWEAMSNAMEADGVPIETINEMSQLVKLAAGLGTTPLDNSERMFMDTVNLYTAAAAMGKSAMNNLYEPAAMGIRGSTVGNPFRTVNAYAETWSRFIRNLIQMLPVLGPHVGPTFWQEYGEHIGSIHNSLDDAWMSMHAMEHGMEETSPAMRWITNRVYQANLMEATENAKLQASHALGHAYILDHAGMLDGSHWIARLLKFDTRSTAEEALLELGIPKSKQDAFAAWCAMVKQTKDRAARMAMLTDGSEMARLYEEAQVRFSHQSAVRANRAHKPVFQDAVLGRLALQLMSFSYSYYSEVTDRMYRMASRAVTTRDMPAIQRINMLLPLMLSPLTVVAMGALFESKDYLFPTESSEKRKKDHWIYKLFNASSFAGAFGPKIEMATKYIARDQPPGGVAGQTIVGAGRVGKKAIELSMDDTKSQAQKEAELKAAAGRAAVAPIKGAAVIAGSALHPVAGAAAVAMTNDTGWSNELQAKPPKKGSLPPSEELPGKRR